MNYVRKTYEVEYTVSGLTDWLYSRNFTYKKPVGLPAKLNEDKQKEFINSYRKLEKTLSDDEELLFMDSCHPTQSTKLGYGWIKKGQEKQIKTMS